MVSVHLSVCPMHWLMPHCLVLAVPSMTAGTKTRQDHHAGVPTRPAYILARLSDVWYDTV